MEGNRKEERKRKRVLEEELEYEATQTFNTKWTLCSGRG